MWEAVRTATIAGITGVGVVELLWWIRRARATVHHGDETTAPTAIESLAPRGRERLVDAAQSLLQITGTADKNVGLASGEEWRRAWLYLNTETQRERARQLLNSGRGDDISFALMALSSLGGTEDLELVTSIADQEGTGDSVRELAELVEQKILERATPQPRA